MSACEVHNFDHIIEKIAIRLKINGKHRADKNDITFLIQKKIAGKNCKLLRNQ